MSMRSERVNVLPGSVICQTAGARRTAVGLFAAMLMSLVTVASASALKITAAPGWEVTSAAYPTYLPPGGSGTIVIDLYNTGGASSSGPVTVTDALPAGVTATEEGGLEPFGVINEKAIEEREHETEQEVQKGDLASPGLEEKVWSCAGSAVVSCTTRPGAPSFKEPQLGPILRPIAPGSVLRIGIHVKVAASAAGMVVNRVTATGGGALGSAAVSSPITIGSATPGFGFSGWETWFSNADGTTDTQAGSHPFDATFSFDLNEAEGRSAGGAVRDLAVELPPGIVGNTNAVPQCTRQQFLSGFQDSCPPSTQVGTDRPRLAEGGGAPCAPVLDVYNLVPPPCVPAQFGFTLEGVNIFLDAKVRSGSDYDITEDVRDIGFTPIGNTLTIWGEPDEKAHDLERCGLVNGIITCDVRSDGSKPT